MKKSCSLLELQQIQSLPNITIELDDSANQDKIKFRRNQVNKLRLRGYTNEEIAKTMRYSLSTIEKDIHEINELSRKWFEEQSINEFCQSLHDSIILCDNAIEDLQILYTECGDIDSKTKVLSKISDFEERKYQLYSNTKSVQDYLKRYCKNET